MPIRLGILCNPHIPLVFNYNISEIKWSDIFCEDLVVKQR